MNCTFHGLEYNFWRPGIDGRQTRDRSIFGLLPVWRLFDQRGGYLISSSFRTSRPSRSDISAPGVCFFSLISPYRLFVRQSSDAGIAMAHALQSEKAHRTHRVWNLSLFSLLPPNPLLASSGLFAGGMVLSTITTDFNLTVVPTCWRSWRPSQAGTSSAITMTLATSTAPTRRRRCIGTLPANTARFVVPGTSITTAMSIFAAALAPASYWIFLAMVMEPFRLRNQSPSPEVRSVCSSASSRGGSSSDLGRCSSPQASTGRRGALLQATATAPLRLQSLQALAITPSSSDRW